MWSALSKATNSALARKARTSAFAARAIPSSARGGSGRTCGALRACRGGSARRWRKAGVGRHLNVIQKGLDEMRYACAIFKKATGEMTPSLYHEQCARELGPDLDENYEWRTVLLNEDEDFCCDECFGDEADET